MKEKNLSQRALVDFCPISLTRTRSMDTLRCRVVCVWWEENLALKPQSREEVLSVESKAKGINLD